MGEPHMQTSSHIPETADAIMNAIPVVLSFPLPGSTPKKERTDSTADAKAVMKNITDNKFIIIKISF